MLLMAPSQPPYMSARGPSPTTGLMGNLAYDPPPLQSARHNYAGMQGHVETGRQSTVAAPNLD